MVLLFPLLLLAISITSRTGATAEWIYRPRSRLFVNTGETARINWKFVSGAIVVVYEKKPNSLGQGNRIALKAAGSPPEVMKSYRDKILVEESGALKIANAQLSDEGFYSIRITYKTNTLTDEVEVKLQEAPSITSFPSHPKSQVYYTGMSINLVCIAEGRPLPEVIWYKNDLENPLEKSRGSIVYKINSASKKDSGKYTCLARNQAGRANRTIEFIIYHRPYDIDFVHNTALDGTIYEGESVIFTCSAKGSPPITYYKLLHDGRELTRTTNGIYKIGEVRLEDNGTYTCVPINKAGLGEYKSTILRVKARPSYWKKKLKTTTTSRPAVVTFVEEKKVESTESTKYSIRGGGHVVHPSKLLVSFPFLFIQLIR